MKNKQLYLWKQSLATVPLHNAGEATSPVAAVSLTLSYLLKKVD
jgi:hypothetical protein